MKFKVQYSLFKEIPIEDREIFFYIKLARTRQDATVFVPQFSQ